MECDFKHRGPELEKKLGVVSSDTLNGEIFNILIDTERSSPRTDVEAVKLQF